MTTNERAIYIYKACRAAGMTHAGAIGLLGNLQGETSNFDPMSVETSYLNRFKLTDAEYTRRADAGEPIYNGKYFIKDSAGYGIAQWTYWGRKKNLLDFAQIRGTSVGDLDTQIAFMLKEMQTHYTRTWKTLTTTGSIADAVKICVTEYEKPANQSSAIEKRTWYANTWAKLISEGGTAEPEKPIAPAAPETNVYDRTKLIALAESEVGYIEKRNSQRLDEKLANGGSANYTKYARDLDAIGDFYNGKKQGHAWCDVFVDWLFVQSFGIEAALKLLCAKRKSSGAGCTYSLNYFIAAGRFHRRGEKPEVGDQIFFGNVGDSNHTGLVYKVDATTVYTIEGNTSAASGVISNGGCVCRKSYPLNYSRIAGYGRPAYNDGYAGTPVEDKPTVPETPKPAENKATCTVTLPELSIGDTGAAVAALQAALTCLEYDVKGIDGDFGTQTKTMLMAFQAEHGLDADGICGVQSWSTLMGGEAA